MAASATDILTLTATASGAVTRNRFVDAAGAIATAAGNAMGVADYDAEDGKPFAATVLGTAVVTAGAAIAAGAAIEVGADGKAVTLAAGTKVARLAPGSSALADGDQVEVFLIPN